MKKILLIGGLAVCAALAQPPEPQRWKLNSDGSISPKDNRSVAIGATILGPKTIGSGANQIPAASSCARCFTVITDGASPTDSSQGGGSFVVPVWSNGTIWMALRTVTGDQTFSATGGQTTFTPTFSVNASAVVFLNGLRQQAGAGNDYTLSGGSVVFASGLAAGSLVEVVQ